MTICFSNLYGEQTTFINIIKFVLNTKPGSQYTAILWFLQKLIVIYLIFPFIKNLYDTNDKLYEKFLKLLIFSTFGINLSLLFLDLIDMLVNNNIFLAISSFLEQFRIVITDNIYLVYFVFGGYVYKNKEKFNETKNIYIGLIAWVIACILGFYISKISGSVNANNDFNFNYSQIFLFITNLGLFTFCVKVNIKSKFINKIIKSIGDNTLGIYLIHTIVFTIININYLVTNCSFIVRLLVSIFVLFVSWILALIIKKIPKVSNIIKF